MTNDMGFCIKHRFRNIGGYTNVFDVLHNGIVIDTYDSLAMAEAFVACRERLRNAAQAAIEDEDRGDAPDLRPLRAALKAETT